METYSIQLGITGLILLISHIVVQRRLRDYLHVDNHDGPLSYVFYRFGSMIGASVIMPWVIGESMHYRLERRFHRRRIHRIDQVNEPDAQQEQAYDLSKKRIAEPVSLYRKRIKHINEYKYPFFL